MKRLLITEPLFEETLEVFRGSEVSVDVLQDERLLQPTQLTRILNDYQGVVCTLTTRLDHHLFRDNPQLEVVPNVAVGYDNIDVESAQEFGIVVTNTPDVLTETTADLTMALILAVARRIPEADSFVRSGTWDKWQFRPEKIGSDVYGKTIGLFGMGRIGLAVARRAACGFGMPVIYCSRTPLPNDVEEYLGAIQVPFTDLLARSDILSLHAPLTPETVDLIGPAELAALKPSSILINTSRGQLIDEPSLVDALKHGRLFGAGLDVFANEPAVHPGLISQRERVVLAPHVGSATIETRRSMARLAAKNALAVLEGRRPLNPVKSSG